MSKLPIIWEEYHYMHYEKNSDWKWSVGIVSVTVALISFMFANITFGVLVLVGTGALLMHALERPKRLRFEINTTGIRIDQESWSFSNLKAFWIEDNKEYHIPSRILFETEMITSPVISLPLPIETNQQDLHDLHSELVQILPERHLTESFFQKILEYFGF
ncbi:MAG: hypothetical protein V4686_02425 [Patescibacteria group bacterium]